MTERYLKAPRVNVRDRARLFEAKAEVSPGPKRRNSSSTPEDATLRNGKSRDTGKAKTTESVPVQDPAPNVTTAAKENGCSAAEPISTAEAAPKHTTTNETLPRVGKKSSSAKVKKTSKETTFTASPTKATLVPEPQPQPEIDVAAEKATKPDTSLESPPTQQSSQNTTASSVTQEFNDNSNPALESFCEYPPTPSVATLVKSFSLDSGLSELTTRLEEDEENGGLHLWKPRRQGKKASERSTAYLRYLRSITKPQRLPATPGGAIEGVDKVVIISQDENVVKSYSPPASNNQTKASSPSPSPPPPPSPRPTPSPASLSICQDRLVTKQLTDERDAGSLAADFGKSSGSARAGSAPCGEIGVRDDDEGDDEEDDAPTRIAQLLSSVQKIREEIERCDLEDEESANGTVVEQGSSWVPSWSERPTRESTQLPQTHQREISWPGQRRERRNQDGAEALAVALNKKKKQQHQTVGCQNGEDKNSSPPVVVIGRHATAGCSEAISPRGVSEAESALEGFRSAPTSRSTTTSFSLSPFTSSSSSASHTALPGPHSANEGSWEKRLSPIGRGLPLKTCLKWPLSEQVSCYQDDSYDRPEDTDQKHWEQHSPARLSPFRTGGRGLSLTSLDDGDRSMERRPGPHASNIRSVERPRPAANPLRPHPNPFLNFDHRSEPRTTLTDFSVSGEEKLSPTSNKIQVRARPELPAYLAYRRRPTLRKSGSEPRRYECGALSDGEKTDFEFDDIEAILGELDFSKFRRGGTTNAVSGSSSAPVSAVPKFSGNGAATLSPKFPRRSISHQATSATPSIGRSYGDKLRELRELTERLRPAIDKAKREVDLSGSAVITGNQGHLPSSLTTRWRDNDDRTRPHNDVRKLHHNRRFVFRSASVPHVDDTTDDQNRPFSSLWLGDSAASQERAPYAYSGFATLPRGRMDGDRHRYPSLADTHYDAGGEALIQDEGLVADPDLTPDYAQTYQSVTSSSSAPATPGLPRRTWDTQDRTTDSRLHAALADTREGSTSQPPLLHHGSLDRRKRFRGGGGTGNYEPVKPGTGTRSLTYPPQRRGSTTEDEVYGSVDSNGLRSYGASACSPSAALIGESHTTDMRRRRQNQQFPSELSLADSHLSPGEASYEATFGDVLEIVTGDSDGLSGSSANGKLAKKKHYSDPSGEKHNEGLLDLPELMMSCAKSEPRLGRDSGNQIRSGTDGVEDGSLTSSPRSLVPRECSTSGGSRTLSPSGGPVPRRSASDCSDRETAFERSLGSWEVPTEKRDTRSPQPQRRYSKKRLRGPYGEMLEEEMRKSGEKQLQKSAISEELSFLNDLIDNRPSSESAVHVPSVPSSPSALRCLDADASQGSVAAIADLDVHRSNGSSLPCPLYLEEDKGDDVTAWNLCEELDADSEDPESQLKRHQDTRTHVVAELYDTEKSYVESLQILVNRYFRPLRSPDCAALVDASLVDEMFFQIPEILTHHENFLETLKQRLENWDNKQKVGDVFVESFAKQPVIDTYTAFINNWKSAKEAIKIATNAKPGFAKFLEHMSREHKGKLALDALLIMPVQRIPRYELLIKELLKHTQVDHPDHRLLVIAQREVHDLAVKINRMEREAHEAEQMQIKLREMEGGIEGLVDLVHPHRVFLRHDLVAMSGSLGAKKERCLFLFSDLLLITSVKRKSGTIRRTPSTPSSPGLLTNLMEMNKYKLLMRIALDDLDVARTNDANIKKVLSDIQQLESDAAILAQIVELAASLNCPHQNLDDLIKEMQASIAKQLQEKQSSDSRLLCLELTVTTQVGVETMAILFSAPEKRTAWEAAFHEAKQKLALSTDRRPPPEFMYPLPIRKTRAGLQFTCAAATLGLNAHHLRDVWVCNSDGYVGQVCILSLQPEPTVASCNGVCNARILCIASVPAAGPGSGFGETGSSGHRRSTLLDGKSGGISISIEDVDEEEEDEVRDGTTCVGNDIQLDSESSEEEKETSSEGQDENGGLHMSPADENRPDDMVDNLQPTMWLGTEDGCIHVYNCNDNIRIKKNKLKLQHSAAVHCIVHLDGRVFVSLANGDLAVYRKDPNGGWETNEPVTVSVGNSVSPVTRMLIVAGKLWCGCQNSVKIVDVVALEVEHTFSVSTDNNRPVHCMATSGLGVWISVQNSSVVRLYHATSFEALLDVNVAPAVSKMLAGCDDIIRQHKAACLRVTALLACKDLLWVGTSAGVVLNLAMPHLTPTTTKSTVVPNVSGIPHGHTGHVRFLTCVEMTPSQEPVGRSRYGHRSVKYKDGRRSSNCALGANRLLVISGGDGYEDFRSTNHSEAAGRDDSTNHLLLWQV